MVEEMREWEEMPIDQVIHSDCRDVLRKLPPNSIDAIVCDPPANLSFMGAKWDTFGHRDNFIAFMTDVFTEGLRVCRPGAHAFVWALPKCSHWTGMALENAGWEVRDCITHLFGQGFPKSMSLRSIGHPELGTALKPAAEFWWLCRKPISESTIAQNALRWNGCGSLNIDQCRVGTAEDMNPNDFDDSKRTAPKFSGILNGGKEGQYRSRTGTVPNGRFPSNILLSHDPRCIARGTKRVRGDHKAGQLIRGKQPDHYGFATPHVNDRHTDEHGLEEVQDFECVEGCPIKQLDAQSGIRKSGMMKAGTRPKGLRRTFSQDVQGGYSIEHDTYGDTGTASRYFTQFHDPLETLDAPFHYFSKSSRRDRNSGLEGMPISETPDAHNLSSNACARCGLRVKANGSGVKCECGPLRETIKLPPTLNSHPTVKQVHGLMRWLVKLVTPPGGIVLDPFCGSGSTCCAAVYEGMHFIGIEQSNTPDAPYVDIARARIAHAQQESRREDSEGQEYICVDGCPINVLKKQSKGTRAERSSGGHQRHNTGNGHGFIVNGNECESSGYDDSKGGASRFFQQFPPEPVSLWDEEEAR